MTSCVKCVFGVCMLNLNDAATYPGNVLSHLTLQVEGMPLNFLDSRGLATDRRP